MDIKAVIFDMDGLMFDTERVANDGMMHALAAQGFAADDAMLARILGLNMKSTRLALEEIFGERLDFDAAFAGMDAYIEQYITAFGTPVKPGLFTLLEHIDALGLPCAVASSSPMRRILVSIEQAGLGGRFDAILSGDDIACGKPAPELFLKAAKALNVEPQSCMVLEDSAAGVEAGKRAGMKTVMVPDLHQPDETDLDGLFLLAASLDEVSALLA